MSFLKQITQIKVRNFGSHNRVFHSLFKVRRNGIFGIKGLNNSKKVTSSGAQSDVRDYYWFRSAVPYQLSFKKLQIHY